MKTKFTFVTLVALVLFSCKQESKKAETDTKKAEFSKIFKVTLDVKVNKDDTFHLFYTEDGSINFSEESSLWVELKGNPENQQVVFNLHENTIPTQMRIDFGINKGQDDMIIKNYKMEYAGKTFNAAGPQFFNLFRPNELVALVEASTGAIKPIKKEGQTYFGPSFYPKEELAKQIEILVK